MVKQAKQRKTQLTPFQPVVRASNSPASLAKLTLDPVDTLRAPVPNIEVLKRPPQVAGGTRANKPEIFEVFYNRMPRIKLAYHQEKKQEGVLTPSNGNQSRCERTNTDCARTRRRRPQRRKPQKAPQPQTPSSQ